MLDHPIEVDDDASEAIQAAVREAIAGHGPVEVYQVNQISPDLVEWLRARNHRAAPVSSFMGYITHATVADQYGRVLYLVQRGDILAYLSDIGVLQCNGRQA